MIKVNNLNLELKDFKLKDISFNIKKGYITGLIGKNGAGKTTLIKCILGSKKIDSGDIVIFGKSLSDDKDYLNDIGIVFDDFYLVDTWRISDIKKYIAPFYKNWNNNVFDKFILDFNLPLDKKFKDYSKGMKIKILLTIALSHNPKILVLDEPTSGLDPQFRYELLGILQNYILENNTAVIFSTHIVEDLDKVADYILLLKDGSLYFYGTKEEILDKFLIIQGDIKDIDKIENANITGIKKFNNSFKALVSKEDYLDKFNEFITINPNLNDILIFV